ncbi:hypothetical protein BTN49_1517 [Candidatus Enterovibrio escicola]|uniref:Uncharacterized protein n=1 Tax=Candidatus Enterovibrio escicola TaxID=1927127 RepID=A0A2A5T466_9GAMM|nr:hypothetical protein BTN49_1517 [Candidatus Enterovibrio escacola]
MFNKNPRAVVIPKSIWLSSADATFKMGPVYYKNMGNRL